LPGLPIPRDSHRRSTFPAVRNYTANRMARPASNRYSRRRWITHKRGNRMRYWAAMFLVIALIAAFLGFAGVATAAAGIAKILFYVFLVIFLVTLIMGLGRRGRSV